MKSNDEKSAPRMKKQIVLLVAILSFTIVISTNAITIDFEEYPNGSTVPGGAEITTQYSIWGVIFDSISAPSATQVTNILSLNSASGRNHLDPGGPAPYNGRILILNFIIPVTDVGSYFIDDQFPIIVNAYDELNNLVDTDSSDGSNSGFDSWHIGYSPGISSVEMVGGYWSYPNSPDGWGIDDLAFSQIPEPATMVLLGLGGLALRISKRRP